MSISCPSLPLSLFEDILKIDTKYEEVLKKMQNEIIGMSSKLKDNSKELEIIHRLFISLNERVNNTNKKDFMIDNNSVKEISNNIEFKIDKLNIRLNDIEDRIKTEVSQSKQEIKEYINEKTEEIHSRLLKNLAFINEQQLKALKIELSRPQPPISPILNAQPKIIEDEKWTKVDKKNYKPK
jgi:hypothetical protein